jgi:glycine betaine/choline ABC-type transport system substrate-binding protein
MCKFIRIGLSLAFIFSISACSRTKPLVVGSLNTTEQTVVGEIVVQHLQRRLGRPVEHRSALPGSAFAYQGLQGGEIAAYVEYTGSVLTQILHEQPTPDTTLNFERARSEMRRVAKSELFEPLGFERSIVMVIRADDPRAETVHTLTQASETKEGWKIGVSYEFQQATDGVPRLTRYSLPMAAGIRGLDGTLLFDRLQAKDVNMITARATDAALTSDAWKILQDDQHLLTVEQACLLVRQDVLAETPGMQAALLELKGKLSTEALRRMNAQVDLGKRAPSEVAKEFLAGMK